jgi:hypothetical protein
MAAARTINRQTINDNRSTPKRHNMLSIKLVNNNVSNHIRLLDTTTAWLNNMDACIRISRKHRDTSDTSA